ncbi:hypothetical protein SDC9_111019 [bioreactor metagenome]|uniref:Uncharacterized protein n=1 Tax=bioreactor metagenome TaxID=1076179 RepID=A0A645BLK2_9ZZZZ
MQQLLRQRQRAQVDRHVDGEHLPAAFRWRLAVEPAFDDGVQPHQGNAGDDAQAEPHWCGHQQGVQQHAAGSGRGKKGEGADVAHPPDQWWRDESAGEEADEVGRTNQAQRGIAVTFQAAA